MSFSETVHAQDRSLSVGCVTQLSVAMSSEHMCHGLSRTAVGQNWSFREELCTFFLWDTLFESAKAPQRL